MEVLRRWRRFEGEADGHPVEGFARLLLKRPKHYHPLLLNNNTTNNNTKTTTLANTAQPKCAQTYTTNKLIRGGIKIYLTYFRYRYQYFFRCQIFPLSVTYKTRIRMMISTTMAFPKVGLQFTFHGRLKCTRYDCATYLG